MARAERTTLAQAAPKVDDMAQWRAVVDLPASPRSAQMGRTIVAAALAGWGRDALVEDAALVASELISNAVQHASGGESYELELVQHGDAIRIYLADGSTIRPVVRELDAGAPHGRGLHLVLALGSAWGVDDHDGGKRVWVDLESDR